MSIKMLFTVKIRLKINLENYNLYFSICMTTHKFDFDCLKNKHFVKKGLTTTET